MLEVYGQESQKAKAEVFHEIEVYTRMPRSPKVNVGKSHVYKHPTKMSECPRGLYLWAQYLNPPNLKPLSLI